MGNDRNPGFNIGLSNSLWGTKFFGGNKYVVWGSMAGLIIAPFGIIIGPFIGAIAGEMFAGKMFAGKTQNTLKQGVGSFIGFLATGVVKLLVSLSCTTSLWKPSFELINSKLNYKSYFKS